MKPASSYRCIGDSGNGDACGKRAYQRGLFCKRHMPKYQLVKITQTKRTKTIKKKLNSLVRRKISFNLAVDGNTYRVHHTGNMYFIDGDSPNKFRWLNQVIRRLN